MCKIRPVFLGVVDKYCSLNKISIDVKIHVDAQRYLLAKVNSLRIEQKAKVYTKKCMGK